MKRGLLIIGLGLAFLILVTGLGTFITNYMPAMKTPQVQTSQAGPYTVTLSVNPNPPSTAQPATFSVQIQQSASHQPVSNARVTLEGSQEDMGLSTSTIEAKDQGNGKYVARVPFSMSGSWQMQVAIAQSGQPTYNAVFMVTAQ
jgi:hypothetical protein